MSTKTLDEPRYTVMVNNRWFPDMLGDRDTQGSSEYYAGIFGHEIENLVVDGVKEYRVATEDSAWRPPVYEYDKNNPAGDGSPIIALQINDPSVIYMVHTKGGHWSKPVYGREKTYAGDMLPIDAVQILRVSSS